MKQGVDVTLGCVTYHEDRGYFSREGICNAPGALDVVSKMRFASAFLRQSLKLLESLINLAALAVRLFVFRPDVIHVQFIPLVTYRLPFELWVLRLAKKRGIGIVYTVHNVLPQDTGLRHKETFRLVYTMVDALVTHNEDAKMRLASEFSINPEKIWVIRHGPLFDCEVRGSGEQVRRHFGLASDQCLVLCQGIIRPYKGIAFLLDAWREVHETGLKANLVIVGTGESKILKEIEEIVASFGLRESVHLELRFVSVEELGNFFEAADILVYPYKEVTTSGALMTGINYGKAIIATALPAFQEVLTNGETALLVRYGDVEGLAGALIRLITDPAQRLRLGRRLQKLKVLDTSWSKIAQQTRSCYEAVLANSLKSVHC